MAWRFDFGRDAGRPAAMGKQAVAPWREEKGMRRGV